MNIRVPTELSAPEISPAPSMAAVAQSRLLIRRPASRSRGTLFRPPPLRPGPAILHLFPDPNTTAGGNVYNYTSQVPSAYPRRENIIRVDWQIVTATRLSGRWVYNHDDQQFAYGTTTASGTGR